jgi:hypothetical protein
MDSVYAELSAQGPSLVTGASEVLRRIVAAKDPRADRGDALSALASNVVSLGDPRAVLARGAETKDEHVLAQALAALATAHADGEVAATTRDLLWLAAHTPFDAFPFLEAAIGDGALAYYRELASLLAAGTLPYGEALVAAVTLRTRAPAMARPNDDERLRPLLSEPPREARAETPSEALRAPHKGKGATIEGNLLRRARAPWATVLLGVTGLLLVIHAVGFVLRMALGYRRRAVLAVTGSRVEVSSSTVLLGRTLRQDTTHLPDLVRISKEQRYPRLGLYAGLFFFLVGTYLGVTTLVDGVRAASPSLLLMGLLFAIFGVALDYVLTAIVPARRARSYLTLEWKTGALRLEGVPTPELDAFVREIAG